MSQKTLLSFFSVKPSKPTNGEATEKKPENDETKGSIDDSPIKTTNKKKRQRISSSESDNNDEDVGKVEKKKLSVSPSKKSYVSKLAKFAASPRKEKLVEDVKKTEEVVKNDDKKVEDDKDEKKEEKMETEVKSEDEKEKSEKKTKKKKEKSPSPPKTEKSKRAKKSPTPEEEAAEKSPSPETSKAAKKSPSPETSKAAKKSPSPEKSKETKTKKKSPSPAKSKEKKNFFTNLSKEDPKAKKAESDEIYSPNKPKYHPIDDACWKHGEKIPYYALARTLEEIEKISARLKMIEILSNFLRSALVLSPDDFLACVYLSLNKIGPAHEGLELGLAEQTLIRALAHSTNRTFTQIKTEVKEVGDLGFVAERSRSSQKLMFQPAPLTVQGIFKKFKEIASMTGKDTVDKKISMFQSLYVACKGPEARFLIRSLNGKLRTGLAEQSVLQAIALACTTTPPGQSYPPENLNQSKGISAETFKSQVDEQALILKTTYCECPNYDLIVPVILEKGIKELPKYCKITPGLPLKPMLAQPTKGIQEVLTRFENMEFTCEWKYDGERAQIHYTKDGGVKIYSRNQEDNTSKYPDVISRLKKAMKEGVTSFILDCEAVAWEKEEKKILPFQILSTRKRKDANEKDIKVQVNVFMFDLLYLNENSLIKEKFFDRRRLLHENFNEVEGEWSFATAIDTSKMEEVQEFLEESIKGNCEGLMVKTLKEEATYEIAKRSRNWLKLKKDYLEGVGDSLDLVVLGGYLGKGKRTGTYGGFLVGCYDEESEEYQSICKLGTGFTDEALATHTEFFKDHVIPNAPAYYQYDSGLEPDHWFEPVQVWETKCADLSLSPVHRAAIGLLDPEKGISLRFPRFLRIREDKKPEDATSARQVIEMYKSQEQVKNQQQKKEKFNEEDFY